MHKQLSNPKEYASKVEAGDNAADTIRTLYSDIEAHEKLLQGNLIKASRHISNLTNQLRKLKANKSASLDIIKQLYFKTPTYQLVGDMVVMKKLKQRLIELTEINKQHKALSPKGIEALIGDPTNADDLRLKLLRPINEALDPIFVKPPDYKRFSSELENFNNTQSILEEIDDPTFLKIYILNDILKMRDSTRNKSKYFSYEVKNEYQNKERVGVVTWSQLEDSPGREDAERFKKANSRKLTKLWSDYTKANEVTLEFMLKNFGYAMGGVVDMRNGGTVGAAVVAASLMASGGQAMDMRNGGVVGMEDGGWLKETSKIASKVGDVLSDVVDDPSKWLKAGVGELFDREQLSGQPLLSSYDLPHAELGKLSEQTLPQKYFGDINRYREIWSMYHGSDPSLEKEIQFVMHQNIKGKAPKQKEIDRITNEIVLDFKGDRGTDPKAPEINTDILAEALRRIAYHETYGGKVKRQAEKGPARGWWQVEPKTAYNMLKGKKGVGEAEDQNFLGPKVRKRLLKQTGLSLKQINKLGRDEFNKLLENNQGFNATVAALNVLTKASQRGKLNLLY